MLPGSFVCLGIIVLLFSGCSGSADPRPNEVAFEPPKTEAAEEGQDLFNRTAELLYRRFDAFDIPTGIDNRDLPGGFVELHEGCIV